MKKKWIYRMLLFGMLGMSLSSCGVCKNLGRKPKPQKAVPVKSPYEKVTTDAKAVRHAGVFDVWRVGKDYYFGIPREMLGRDLLVVNRVLQVPAQLNEAGINKGINYENILVRIEPDETYEHLYIRNIKPMPHVPKHDDIALSVRENFVSPIMGRLKVEGLAKDSSKVLVKVNDLYDGSSSLFNNLYKSIGIGGAVNKELSRIVRARAFDDNITVVSDLSTKVTEGKETAFLTVRTASSILLLPKKPYRGRELSERVGYFSVPFTFYSDNQTTVEKNEWITRWRLEPKDQDAYLRGEKTEPLKPITFYIDKSTPERWRKYIKKGIEDWNVAFEYAGFKNAISVIECNDSVGIDKDNLKFSGVNYVASEMMNAMGPSVYDPRSGEIIQADIIWWHNVLDMLRSWIILQTANNAKYQINWDLPEEVLGDAMRFVACHEVGHSLGLRHNMIASSAYGIAQLRDPDFVRKHGTSASIMDYARFNYVAQPEDGVSQLSPQIGEYDLFAIEYGYRWFPPTVTDESQELQKILDRHQGKLYRYSEAQDSRAAIDPRAQTEDLSDDPVTASTLGIKNLKKTIDRLTEITAGNGRKSYQETGLLYNQLINYWNTLLYHPLALIGGMHIDRITRDDNKPAYTFVSKAEQLRALDFILTEAIENTDWLFRNKLATLTYPIKKTPKGNVEQSPSLVLKNAQSYVFWDLLDDRRIIRMGENMLQNGNKALAPTLMTDIIFKRIFKKTLTGKDLDTKERYIQKGLVDALIEAAQSSKTIKNKKLTDDYCNTDRAASQVIRDINFNGTLSDRISDAISVKRQLLLRILRLADQKALSAHTTDDKAHYTDIALRIKNALEIR